MGHVFLVQVFFINIPSCKVVFEVLHISCKFKEYVNSTNVELKKTLTKEQM